MINSGQKNIKRKILSALLFCRSASEGITLLLVVVIFSALFSISLGIFTTVFEELRISGEIGDSSIAFYAADQGIERTLYRDRIQAPLCNTGGGPCTASETSPILASGGCFVMNTAKDPTSTTITVAGQYRCGLNPARIVKRGLQIGY